MPKTDASIALSLQDNMSESIRKVQSSLSAFGNDVEGFQKQLDALSDTQLRIKTDDLKRARSELAKARKEFNNLGESATETERELAESNFKQATKNYENVKAQLALLSKQAKQTQKDMLEADNAISKAENRAEVSQSVGVMESLAQAGLLDMIGDASSEAIGALVTSSYGSDTGALISSVLGSAASGAAIGSLAGLPGPGTAIGAGVGALAGLISGATSVFENEDAAFIDYYNSLYESVSAATAESITSGSAVAAQREQDAIAFNQLLGAGVGDQYLENLRVLAAKTPMEYEDLTAMSRALATGFGDSPDRMLELMTAIGDAGSAVGVTAADMSTLAEALSRMESSDKAALEYLNIFQDRGIDVIGMLANSMGKTKGDIYDMISKSEISGGYAVDVIQKGMETAFSGAMEEMSRTFDGLTSTLSDAMTEIDNAAGQGYNATRSEGLEAEINAYGGQLGTALQSLNEIIGSNQAYMENLSDQYQREALSALLMGWDTTLFSDEDKATLDQMRDEYLQSWLDYEQGNQDAGLKMEALKEQAETMATAAYESSEQYQTVNDTELDLIEAIRNNTDAVNAASLRYDTSQSLTKGMLSSYEENTKPSFPGNDASEEELRSYQEEMSEYWRKKLGYDGSNAFGLKRVPYDNYVALLHQGERVLTASEARAADSSAARPVTVTFSGPITINQDSDIDTLAGKLADAITLATKAGVR